MLRRPLIIFSFIFLCLSVLNPVHDRPWPSFFSEVFAFAALILLLPLLLRKQIIIPKSTLPFLIISFIPLLQYIFGQLFFFTNAILSALYLFSFWLSIVISYNLSEEIKNSNKILDVVSFIACFFIAIGVVSSLIAIAQWLNIWHNSPIIMPFTGNRPYANMAQPNHLSTIICCSIISCWYFYEKNKLKPWIATSLCILFIFMLAIIQSRTTWIIALFSVGFIVFQSNYIKLRVSKIILGGWILYFISSILILPLLNSYLGSYFRLTSTDTLAERVGSGYGRLTIWNQMLHALAEHPWLGYGWNQTTAAQFAVIDQIHGNEWVTSAHNLMLDILIWCGLPIGLVIIGFITYFYLKIFRSAICVKSIFSILIISVIGIHTLLEFPIYYSYFFLPVGMVIGVVLATKPSISFNLKFYFIVPIFTLGCLVLALIFNEYTRVNDNLFAGRLHAMGDLRGEVKLPYNLYFLDYFDSRARWLALYSQMEVDKDKLLDSKHMVQTNLTPYDIHKYAQLLAYNGHERQAKRQLKILNIMYKMDITYESLFDRKERDYIHMDSVVSLEK